MKNIIPSRNSYMYAKKNLYNTCSKCNLTGIRERKKGMCCHAKSEKERCDNRARRRLLSVSVIHRQCKIFARLWGEGRIPEANRFPIDTFFRIPWKDIMRFHEEYKSYEIYCRIFCSVHLCLYLRFEDWG